MMHPGQVRFVKPYLYRATKGENAQSVTRRFGMAPYRWRELAAANRHKMHSGIMSGACPACFENLKQDEPLRIPAWWNDPLSSVSVLEDGTVGDPIVIQNPGSIDLMRAFVDAWITAFPGVQVQGVTIKQALELLWTWWPYLADVFNRNDDPVPTWIKDNINPPASIDPSLVGVLMPYVVSAANFLKATGIKTTTQVMPIPWTNVNWWTVPWPPLANAIDQGLANMILGFPTTLPIQRSKTGLVSAPIADLPQGMAPDFASEDWTDDPWKDVKWTTPGVWDQRLVLLMNDPEAMACLKSHPDRVAKMNTCASRWNGANAETIKAALCAAEGTDVCSSSDLPKLPDGSDVPVPDRQPPPDGAENVVYGDDGKSKEDNTTVYIAAGVVGVLLLGAVVAAGGRR